MEEQTVAMLEAEIQELNRVDGVDESDGFLKITGKQLEKICGKCERESTGTSTSDGASGFSFKADFKENKTSLTTAEAKHKAQCEKGDIYDFTHPTRGLAVIINNEDFDKNSQFGSRPGSSYDSTALYQTFKKLGFKVFVKTNLTAVEMVELLKLANKSFDHEKADCFVCAILTHGDEAISNRASARYGSRVRRDLLFGTDGEPVLTSAVVDIFSDKNCPGLIGKPRLFFLQACRGSKYDHGVEINVLKTAQAQQDIDRRNRDQKDSGPPPIDQIDSRSTKRQISTKRQTSFSSSVDPPQYHQYLNDSTDTIPDKFSEVNASRQGGSSNLKVRMPVASSQAEVALSRDVPVCPTPLYKDCLIMYATPPGHYAWRRKNGAWFVQSVCEVLNRPEIGRVSLLKALVQAAGKVAFSYQSENPSNPQMHQKKEIPVIESMLMKDIYFK